MDWNSYKTNFKITAENAGKDSEYIESNLKYAKEIFEKGLPIIYNNEHLSLLVGIKLDYIMSVVYSQKHFYRTFKINKKNGKKRLISEPLPLLKRIQQWILQEILEKTEVSRFAKAYVKNVSLKENAKFHKNQNQVLKLDIEDFFSSLKSNRIFLYFMELGYNSEVSLTLTNLCTLNDSLPQGACTSPYLSNILMKQFDKRISKYCIQRKIRYTRYADDMTFSGSLKPGEIISYVETVLESYNLKLNKSKIRNMKRNQRQEVTGITVNEKFQISRKKRNNIRLKIYYIEKNGIRKHLENQNLNISPEKYLKSLLGEIEFGLFINPYDYNLQEYKVIIKKYLSSY